ncbi:MULTISPECIES: helix-turn-helix transcriptional regulator [Streptacidiphilus]|uniref:Helix-turn-helix domain-containing protein n=1 Tax=Streptacidiphilus cavernicola TaxID=3342716 RepID=A0ABV6UTQ8_9ACTN|nr:helix-turn-helix transcriptional regulator [Streptacidiphilus jeojiense]
MSTDFQQARVTLGARLLELRAEAGLTGRQLAERLGWTQSKVSKLETGKQTATVEDLRAWAQAVGEPGSGDELVARLRGFETRYRTWRRQLASGHRPRQELGGSELARSQTVRCFEPAIVPGLMQTADYARHVLTHNAEFRESVPDTEDAVRARLKRQEALYERERRFHFLIWEAALHVVLCPPEVLIPQLDRIGGLIGLDNVSVGILPLRAPMRRSPAHGFMIYDERLVTVETFNTEMWLDDTADIQLYDKAWSWLSDSAVFGRQARRLISLAQAALEAP